MPTATSCSSLLTRYRHGHVLRRDRPVQRVPRDRRRHLQPAGSLVLGRTVQLHPTRPRQISRCATRSQPPQPARDGSARPEPRGSASARCPRSDRQQAEGSGQMNGVAVCRKLVAIVVVALSGSGILVATSATPGAAAAGGCAGTAYVTNSVGRHGVGDHHGDGCGVGPHHRRQASGAGWWRSPLTASTPT